MAKMHPDEIRAVIGRRMNEATSNEELAEERKKALDLYYGRPLGNEIDGRSQVVSKDMMDTVEWMMPSLMRVFTTQNAVQFDPVGPEDEQQAKLETEYVRHVFWKQNPGFITLHNWLKDGLMQKVGYVKYWWEEEEKVCYEEYEGLSADQVTLLDQLLSEYGDAEVLEHEVTPTAPGVFQTFNVKYRIKQTKGRARVECCPPEEIIVSADCRGAIKTAKFVGHRRKVSRSDLLEMGYSREVVEGVTDYDWKPETVNQSRDPEDRADAQKDEGVDWATYELDLLECFTYVDIDGDGIAELRHFLLGGSGEFLENKEVDEIPLCSWTPKPIPHQHIGIGPYDQTEDIQRIKTGLVRSLLDNAYFSNNHRLLYDKNTVNVRMLQVNRPGGHVAVDGPPGGSVVPILTQDVAPRLLPVIGYQDDVRARRTGVSDMTTGVDADVLAQSTKGAYMDAKGASNQQIEATCRVFAEMGMTDLFASLHKLLSKHQDWETKFQLKNDWPTTNPSEWKERTDLTVSVGLGNAGKEEIRANLMLMGQTLQQLAQVPGLVQPVNAYNYGKRIQVELGLESEQFLTDPNSPEYQKWAQQASQQAPDPYLEAEKLKSQTRLQEKQIDSRDKALDRDQKTAVAIMDNEVDVFKAGLTLDIGAPGIGSEAGGGGTQGAAGAGTAQQQPAQ